MNRTLEQIISIPLWPFLFINTYIHWSMTKGNYRALKLKKASAKDLKNKMLSIKWEFYYIYPNSLFAEHGEYEKHYFHASIFVFDNVGYMLTPYGYLIANILQRRIRKTLPGFEKFCKPYIK